MFWCQKFYDYQKLKFNTLPKIFLAEKMGKELSQNFEKLIFSILLENPDFTKDIIIEKMGKLQEGITLTKFIHLC